jgi:uncharacterized protein (DUF849 family)
VTEPGARPVVVTCAVTGGGDAGLAHPRLPVTPKEIAAAAVEALDAGAAVIHVHVRDPETRRASHRFELYAELMDRLRGCGREAIINVTASMAGQVFLTAEGPMALAPETTLSRPAERARHVLKLKPDIATLDCGSMTMGESVFVARRSDLAEMARLYQAAGIKPELECFELGHLETARSLIDAGLIEAPPLVQICLGTGYGAAATPAAFEAMRASLPAGVAWAAFGCHDQALPIAARAVLAGGHVRVGLEDTLRLGGEFTCNGRLVERACRLIEDLGHPVATVPEARAALGLTTVQNERRAADAAGADKREREETTC